MRIVHLLLALIFAAVSLPGAEPQLWFGKGDIPKLKERAERGPDAEVWRATLAAAEAWVTPGTATFLSPEQVEQGPETGRVQIAGHYYGRRLTEWMETLGFAFQLTGDQRFARHGVALLERAALKLPVTHPQIAPGFAGARGDIMRGLAVGYDWLGETMTPEQRMHWAETAAGYVRNVLAEVQGEAVWWRPYHNFMGVAVGAAGLLALELRESYPQEAPGWIRVCTEMVGRWLDEGFDEDGAYVEGTQYGFYGLSNAIRFADALQRSGGANLFEKRSLRNVPWFYAMSLLPGEAVYEARIDANYDGAGDPTLLRLAAAHQSGLAKWLWQQTGEGHSVFRIIWANDVVASPPDTQSPGQHFRGRGLCIWRTGWTSGDVMFSVEAGPFYPVTHNQGDKGHFTLYGLGERWALDSGYGNNRLPGGRDSTLAHNAVLVDGEGQAPSGAGAGTSGRITDYQSDARWGYASAELTEAYQRNSGGKPGVNVERARRHLAFVRPADGLPAYAVVLDDLKKDAQEREYTWLLHFPDKMRLETRANGVVIRPERAFPSAYLETPAEAKGAGRSEWEFEVRERAEFGIRARVRAGGAEVSRSDSFFVEVDGQRVAEWHMPGAREWTWGAVTDGLRQEPVKVPLAPGKYRLRFATREAGAQVEQVELSDGLPGTASPKSVILTARQARVTAPMVQTKVDGDARAPKLVLWLTAASSVRYEIDRYEQHQRLKATVRATSPDFAAVLLPLPAEVPEPQFEAVRQAGALQLRLRWNHRDDQWTWPDAGERRPVLQMERRPAS